MPTVPIMPTTVPIALDLLLLPIVKAHEGKPIYQRVVVARSQGRRPDDADPDKRKCNLNVLHTMVSMDISQRQHVELRMCVCAFTLKEASPKRAETDRAQA